MIGIVVIIAVAVMLGAWLGVGRLASVVISTGVGAASTPILGPALFAAWSRVSDGPGLEAAIVCHALAYVAVAWLTARAIASAVRYRRGRGCDISRRSRYVGATFSGVGGAILAWAIFGNLSTMVVEQLPATSSADVVRRPFELLHASRVLCSIDRREAEWIGSRGEIRAVFASAAFDKLLRTPGVVRRLSAATEGDWPALAQLAADPNVADVLDDPELIARLRDVDIVALAAEIERRRKNPANSLKSAGGEFEIAALPPIAREKEFQEAILGDWHEQESLTLEPHATSERYWRTVGSAINLIDRSTRSTAWLPLETYLSQERTAPK